MNKCSLVADDIWLVPEDEGYKLVFQSLEGFNIIWTKDQAEQVKQNILNHQVVVERLQSIVTKIEKNNDYHASQGCATSIIAVKPYLDELKEILNTTYHSEDST